MIVVRAGSAAAGGCGGGAGRTVSTDSSSSLEPSDITDGVDGELSNVSRLVWFGSKLSKSLKTPT